MQHINYPTAFLVTDSVGNAGSILVNLKTTKEEFVGWYVTAEIGGDVTRETIDQLESVLLYLQTAGRRRELEQDLGLKVEPVEDSQTKQTAADYDIVRDDTIDPQLRVLKDGKRVWDFGELGASAIRLGVVRSKTSVDVVEYALDEQFNITYYVIRHMCSTLEDAVRKAAELYSSF